MLQVVILVILLAFVVAVVIGVVAGPVYEAVTDVVANDDAVQSMGHANDVMNIQDTVLEILAPVLILMFILYGFVYILRRERYEGGLGP